MKIATSIGLTAIAALILLASFGAGSAFAAETTLCQKSTIAPYCEASEQYPAKTKFDASATNFKLTSPIVNVICSESAIHGETTAATGTPLPLSISAWTANKCLAGCETQFKNLPYAGSLTRVTGSNGTLGSGNGSGGEPRLFVQCGEILHCEYAIPNLSFEGGSPAHFGEVEKELVKKGGLVCPSTTKLTVTYAASAPATAYLAEPLVAHTRLCKESKKTTEVCPITSMYPAGTTIEAVSSDFKWQNSVFTSTCSNVSVSAKTVSASGEPLPLGSLIFAFSGCTNGCTVSASGPLTGSIRHVGELAGEVNLKANLHFICGAIDCTLSTSNHFAAFTGGNPATFEYKEAVLDKVAGTLCPSTNYMTAKFTVTSPKPLYAA